MLDGKPNDSLGPADLSKPDISSGSSLPVVEENLPAEREVSLQKAPTEEPIVNKPPKQPVERSGELLFEQPTISQSPEMPVSGDMLPPADSSAAASAFLAEEKKSSFFGSIGKILPILLIILLVAISAFAVVKFIIPRFQNPEQTTLTYWGLWEPEEVMRGVLADWEKENPNIKVNYVRQSQKEYRERLQSALARGEGPDIFRFHISWLPMIKNELEPLPQKLMSPSEYEASYYPVVVSNLRSGTSYLGMPLMFDSLALYYNEDIFQAGAKSPPKTWEELRQLAVDLTVKDDEGRIQTAGVALGTVSNVDHWSDILGLMMLQNGVDLSNPGNCTKRAEEEVCLGADALTFYTIFNKVDKVWDDTLSSSTLAFATGKVAMYFGPSWRVFDIKQINPRLNFKIVPVPQLSEINTTWATFWVEGVAKKSKYPDKAWEFLKFLSSSQSLEKLYQAESNVRLFGEPYPRIDMADKLKTNPLVFPFIDQASKSQTWYLCSNTFDNGINERMIKYYEDAVNAVNLGKTAKEALQITDQGVSQLLSQYGLSTSVER